MEKLIKIKTPDKYVIYGMLNWKNKTDKLIIFVHGLSGDINNEPFYNASRFFPQNGFSTARISLYEYQSNARKLISSTIRDHAKDIETAVKYFKKKFSKIYLVGHSLGCPSILLSNMDNVYGIVLWDPSNPDSTFEKTLINKRKFNYTNWGIQIILNPDMIKEWIKLRKNIFSIAENTKIPMKIICGGKGILWKKWKQYFKNKRKNQYFSIVKEADHCFYEEGSQAKLFDVTLLFLKKINF